MTENRQDELNRWIARLECEESSWANYERLAVLYAIRNHSAPERWEERAMMYSAAGAPETTDLDGNSDFLRAVQGKDPAQAWAVMDELMDTLHIVNERVYNNVMRKLHGLNG